MADVKARRKMIKEALGKKREHTQYRAAAAHYHKVMLTEFPKVTLRMYDHALLVHVPDLLAQGISLMAAVGSWKPSIKCGQSAEV
jgi:hypothetical protein